jgi:hypothetical protein
MSHIRVLTYETHIYILVIRQYMHYLPFIREWLHVHNHPIEEETWNPQGIYIIRVNKRNQRNNTSTGQQ